MCVRGARAYTNIKVDVFIEELFVRNIRLCTRSHIYIDASSIYKKKHLFIYMYCICGGDIMQIWFLFYIRVGKSIGKIKNICGHHIPCSAFLYHDPNLSIQNKIEINPIRIHNTHMYLYIEFCTFNKIV